MLQKEFVQETKKVSMLVMTNQLLMSMRLTQKSNENRGAGIWMEKLYKDGIVSEELYNNFVFYKKAFWICFAYLLWDMFRSFGWL